MGIKNISSTLYNMQYGKSQTTKNEETIANESLKTQEPKTVKKQISAEEKIKQANEFWAQHDALYAEQMATVMNTISDGMQVAQEIARRMSSGAKVSPADEQNLMLYDPRMYAAAKSAQMMAQKKEDKSDEVLIDEFVERHANDRKDWTSELDEKIKSMSIITSNEGQVVETDNSGVQGSGVSSQSGSVMTSVDISI